MVDSAMGREKATGGGDKVPPRQWHRRAGLVGTGDDQGEGRGERQESKPHATRQAQGGQDWSWGATQERGHVGCTGKQGIQLPPS